MTLDVDYPLNVGNRGGGQTLPLTTRLLLVGAADTVRTHGRAGPVNVKTTDGWRKHTHTLIFFLR